MSAIDEIALPIRGIHRRSLPVREGTAVLCASVLINLLSVVAPLTALLVYDRVLVNEGRATLAILIAGAIVFILTEAALRLIRAGIISRASAHADFVAREGVMAGLLRRPLQPGRRLTLLDLTAPLTAVGAFRELRFAKLLALVDLPFGLAFLILIGLVGGWTVALPAGVCFAFLLIFGVIALANERALRGTQLTDRNRSAFVETVGSSMHAVTALGAQVHVVDRFVQRQLDRSGAQRGKWFVEFILRDTATTFSQILVGAVIVAGALTVLEGNLGLGGLAACTLLAGRSLEPLQNTLHLLVLSRRARLARDTLASIGPCATRPALKAGHTDWTKPPAITFSDARIFGPDDSTPIIATGAVTFPEGEIVSITGDRGTGKSTLGLALFGMAKVEGTLSVGDIDATGPEAETIRGQASYLPRLPQLPAGRLLDVLTDGSETLYADVRYLAHLIGLDETVKRLPAGYDTILRTSVASELSAGVRQQIAICRMLAKKRKLIVADDPTCVLDAATELRFADVIKRLAGEATVVLLTDKSSLNAIASRRFTISGGRLAPMPSVIKVHQ